MVVKTFRGQLKDGGQDHIRLQTIKGKVGYRIHKFQVINRGPPGTLNVEAVFKITKTELSTFNGIIDFTDSDLLGIAYYTESSSPGVKDPLQIIFDREVFNQDIYISYKDSETSETACNYYLELEVIPLTDSDAEFTTLKDIRGRNTTP